MGLVEKYHILIRLYFLFQALNKIEAIIAKAGVGGESESESESGSERENRQGTEWEARYSYYL
jgi:hypothetical protein